MQVLLLESFSSYSMHFPWHFQSLINTFFFVFLLCIQALIHRLLQFTKYLHSWKILLFNQSKKSHSSFSNPTFSMWVKWNFTLFTKHKIWIKRKENSNIWHSITYSLCVELRITILNCWRLHRNIHCWTAFPFSRWYTNISLVAIILLRLRVQKWSELL